MQHVSMIVKAEGPSGPAKIHSDDPKHAVTSNSQLSTAKARILSRFPVVVLKAGGLRSKLRNGFTYALHTGGIGHLVNAVPVFSGASTVFH